MEQSTINTLVAIALALVSGGIGWFARTVWSRIDKNEDSHTAFRIEVARDYVSTKDLDSVMTSVRTDLSYIRTRIDVLGTPARRSGD